MTVTKVTVTFVLLLVIYSYKDTYVDASSLKISNNRYDDLVIAISPTITENTRIIEKIKEIITKASPLLYQATRKRAYFGNVKILVPKTWTYNSSWTAESVQTFEEADIRIDKPNPVINDPYTFQPEGCGDPGQYIHLTEDYVLDVKGQNIYTYGPSGWILVHEFSHLRYGVFDEYGLGTNEYPNFYLDDNIAQATACAHSIRGLLYGDCDVNKTTNLPGKNCSFVGNLEQNTAAVSVMYDAAIQTVTTYCESGSLDAKFRHNQDAPNQQNKMCNRKGTWDVIKEHADFKGANSPVNKTDTEMKPTFTILYGGKATTQSGGKVQEVCGRPVILVLDVSGSMSQGRDFKQIQTADKLIRDVLPVGTKVGIVSFSSTATKLKDLTTLSTTADRTSVAASIPTIYAGGTGIGSGLLMAMHLLISAELKDGRILLITDGEENVTPFVADVKSQIVSSGIRVHAVAYSKAAAIAIRSLSDLTGGQYAYYSEGASSTALDSVIERLMTDISTCNEKVRMEIQRKAEILIPNSDIKGDVIIDPTLGKDTMFVFTLPKGASVTVTLTAPDGTTVFTSSSPEYSRDSILNIVRFKIPEAQAYFLKSRPDYTWHYTLRSSSSGSVVLVVKALPEEGKDPYKVTSWLSSSANDLDPKKPAIVYVHVHKGYSPVIDANVTVTVERPTGQPVDLTPMDNGILPDNMAGDGVYSTYFTQYNGNDRYSLDVEVQNILGKTFYYNTSGEPIYGAAAARFHNTTTPAQKILADNFTRTTSPGAMDVNGYQTGKDNYPPSQVTDLKVVAFSIEKRTVTLTWTAPGDDLNTGTASDYEIRMAKSAQQLQNDFDNRLTVNPSIIIAGDLKPEAAGSKERITITTPDGWATIVFALQTRDDAHHSSGVSNIATATFKQVTLNGQPTVQKPNGNPQQVPNNGSGGSDTAIIIAVVCGILGGFIIIGIVIIVVMRQKNGKNVIHLPENPLESQMTEPNVAAFNSHYVKM